MNHFEKIFFFLKDYYIIFKASYKMGEKKGHTPLLLMLVASRAS